MLQKMDRIVSSDLEEKYDVDDYFYPKISFELEVPGQLRGEVGRIQEQLRKVKVEPTAKAVYTVLCLKRDLVRKYFKNPEQINQFRDQIAGRIKPIGAISPLEYSFATIVLVLAFSYLKSFGDELGRISARKLLNEKDDRRISGQLKCSVEEVRLAKPDAILVLYKLRRKLPRRKKPRTRKDK